MARARIKVRYKVRVTRTVRVESRVTYRQSVWAVAQQVVTRANARGDLFSEQARCRMIAEASAELPSSVDRDEIVEAIDATCVEIDDEYR